MLKRPTAPAAIVPVLVVAGACLAGPASATPPTTVLELFTSQGCSSCPPADTLFQQYAGRPDVLALTFNVDYWDYLGWKDTLANADNADRQREYAAARGDGQIYTPQVVVDGHSHVIGSDRKQVEKAIAANAGTLTVPLTLSSSSDAITVTVADSPRADIPHATLWLVMYNPSISVAVGHGENGGRVLTYTNVVRKLRPIAMWKGQLLSVDIPISELTHAKAIRGAVILQLDKGDGQLGVVLGAATIDLGQVSAAAVAAPTQPPPAPTDPAPAR